MIETAVGFSIVNLHESHGRPEYLGCCANNREDDTCRSRDDDLSDAKKQRYESLTKNNNDPGHCWNV